jgi:hypothetical protein
MIFDDPEKGVKAESWGVTVAAEPLPVRERGRDISGVEGA